MLAHNRKTAGFTLVEILIVVVILGILAAIVIPQFTSASESARASSLVSQLQTIRSQLELFQVQHNGIYPPAPVAGQSGITWDPMTQSHSFTVSNGALTFNYDNDNFGPYLQKFPANPFAGSSTTLSDHWWYDQATGRIVANVSSLTETQRTDLGLTNAADFATSDPFN